MTRSVSRRRFLGSSALAGIGAGAFVFAAGQAQAALKLSPMDAETHTAYRNACGGPEVRAYHDQLLEEARTKLAGTMSEKDLDAALAALTCPICGCHLEG
ncbi:MAG TPA: hypothetical protein VEC75_07725 [Stellaceae bacterium]|nr:hypothetical protein [Stellaceae bacterium]